MACSLPQFVATSKSARSHHFSTIMLQLCNCEQDTPQCTAPQCPDGPTPLVTSGTAKIAGATVAAAKEPNPAAQNPPEAAAADAWLDGDRRLSCGIDDFSVRAAAAADRPDAWGLETWA